MIKQIKRYHHIIWLILGFVITAGAYYWFIKSIYFVDFLAWTEQHTILYFSVLVLIKIIAIVWPPLPGGIFTISAIPVLGWQEAYLADAIGSVTGATITFFIGKKYGYAFVERFFDEKVLEKVKKTNIKQNKQIEAIAILRVVLMEVIFYTAGLLNVKYKNFLLGVVIGHAISVIPIYYITADLISTNNYEATAIKVAVFVVLAIFFIIFRKRYLEEIESN